jgi:hypothetical protein
MDNRIKILIVFPLAFIIILFIAATYVPFREEFTEAEEYISAFMPTELSVKEMPEVSINRQLRSPLNFGTPGSAGVKESSMVSEKDFTDNAVSLIVVSGKRKMAIIGGVIVREGDSIDGMKIAKIEPDRVLLKNRTERWLFLEKER